jgi:hypothetical protein
MSDKNKQLTIFLCHGSEDKSYVRDMYRRLSKYGIRPWLDEEDLLPGQDWDREIRKAVKASDVILVCLSRNSVQKSGYVQKELVFALDAADEKPEGTIYLIPLRLEECVMPDRLSRWHWVNYYEPDGHIRLLKALKIRASELGKDILTED